MSGGLPQTRAVILVGFMGAGKSSVGRALAEQLGWTFEDLDERIERRERQTVAGIFRNSGEAGFRRAENAALKELLEELRSGSEKVIGLGGGAFVHEANAALIEAVKIPTVFLDGGVEELWGRCKQQSEEQGTDRPLLGSPEGFRELYEKRRPHYLRASLRQETGGKGVEEIAAELIQALGLGGGRGRS
ncbi:MAG: shikimate kinase [Candidatus Sulfotelmatobacter sp.]